MQAALLMSFVIGRWHRFARSGFRKLPSEGIDVKPSYSPCSMTELHLSKQTIHFVEPLPLQSGTSIENYDLVVETYGQLNA
jgi:hypothetical protein